MNLRALPSSALKALSAPVPRDLMRAFRLFFGIHIFLESLKLFWSYPNNKLVLLVQAVLLVAAVLSAQKRFYRTGVFLQLIYKGYQIFDSYPMSGNHYFAEALVLVLLLIFPDQPVEDGEPQIVEGSGCHLLQLSMITIYFFAGIHKLVHGFWLNGEFVARSLFPSDDFGMWHATRALFVFLRAHLGGAQVALPLPTPKGFETMPFAIPGWTLALFLGLSWLTVATEVGVPLLFFTRRFNRLAIWFMLVLQIAIGVYSWETEFMFGAVGSILLFFPDRPWRNFGLLALVHAAWSIFVVTANLRIWEL